jgi:SAM-dependent methyltransferase
VYYNPRTEALIGKGNYSLPTPNEVVRIKVNSIEKFRTLMSKLESLSPKQKLFDVCCGMGGLIRLSEQKGWEAEGNELNTKLVPFLRETYNITVHEQEFESCNFKSESYGAIVFHHGIEHVRNPALALSKALDMLVPKGVIYLAHPMMLADDPDYYMEKSGHVHEWTYFSFGLFISQFDVEVLEEGHSTGLAGQKNPPVQYWWLCKK